MARLNNINREELSSSDQEYYDSIVGSRGSVRGPVSYTHLTLPTKRIV